jgi:CheY-like chemotaxis protein
MSNILIIDDEKAIRKTLSEILSYEGYKLMKRG